MFYTKQKVIINFILLSILIIITSICCCTSRIWRYLTIHEIIFHLNRPINGIDYHILYRYIIYILIPFIVFVFMYFDAVIRKQKKNIKILNIGISLVCFFAILYSLCVVKFEFHTLIYVNDSKFIEDHYLNPDEVKIVFNKKRNLIHIYIESMETSYSKSNLIPKLYNIAKSGTDFSGKESSLNGGYYTYGASWTAASMFAQNTGLPFKEMLNKTRLVRQENIFSPKVSSLGKILQNNEYALYLIMGTDSKFAATNIFLNEHGNYTIFDYNWFVNNNMEDPGNKKFWGAEDYKGIEAAKFILNNLIDKKKPFVLDLFTIDTHVDGFLTHKCQTNEYPFEELLFKNVWKYKKWWLNNNEYKNNFYKEILRCSDMQLYNFIEWIKQQDFYKNTTIILTGDHPVNFYFKQHDNIEQRKTYFAILNYAQEDFIENKWREYNLFDYFPTILSAIGAEIPGERLGLGTNLFSNVPTLTEQYGHETILKELKGRSKFLNELLQ